MYFAGINFGIIRPYEILYINKIRIFNFAKILYQKVLLNATQMILIGFL